MKFITCIKALTEIEKYHELEILFSEERLSRGTHFRLLPRQTWKRGLFHMLVEYVIFIV